MDKAEKRALEAYPIEMDNVSKGFNFSVEEDINEYPRRIFLNGYRMAEKDLELTWEDMKTIIELDGNVGECDDFHGSQKYYEKVLEMFKEKRK